jgi:DNA-binding FadR family transcriptional regulator
LTLTRVKKAYQQIADQLREAILVGSLKPGMRLPTEQELAAQLGVSRATVRESLRVLATEGLLRTAKGAGGGSFVSHPNVAQISDLFRANISLLSASREVSLDEFLEARDVLEVPAARMAAKRRSRGDVEMLLASIPEEPSALGTAEQFVMNRDFHSAVIGICGNTLLALATRPIFLVLQTRLARSKLDAAFHNAINEHHRVIADAIDLGDSDRAGAAMADHLGWLRPTYERVWREALSDDS